MSKVRLIDANALKDSAYINKGNFNTVEGIREWIDNAPTVEIPENEVNCVLTMFGKCSYNETGCSDCEIKDKIRKALNERPQGEWKPLLLKTLNEEGDDIVAYESSCCGAVADKKYQHCPKCLAKMKGGKENRND